MLSIKISVSLITATGGRNLLLSLLSKTVHRGLIVFNSGDLSGKGRCWSLSWRSNCQGFMIMTIYFCILAMVCVIKDLAIAALSWMLDLRSSLRLVFVVLVFRVDVEMCCLCCSLDTIFSPCHSLSVFFDDEVLPWFVYKVIIQKIVSLKRPKNEAIRLPVLMLNGFLWYSGFGSSASHLWYVLNTAEHKLYYNDKQPREYTYKT